MAKTSLSVRDSSSNKQIQTIEVLLSSITHEIGNYLAVISLNAESSEKELKTIRETVKNAGYLINNLQLQIKGMISGEVNKEGFKRYSMLKNIEEALEYYPFGSGDWELVNLDTSKDFEYIGDPALTNHILYNLIKNAIRAIKNSGKGLVAIKLEGGTGLNRLVFRDTASGIPKKFLPKMFELFESGMRAQGGTGIGLAYCKQIMTFYGGDITCKSTEGEYTEFVLSFPRIP